MILKVIDNLKGRKDMSVVTSAKLGVGWKVLGYRTHVTRSATLGEQNELIL